MIQAKTIDGVLLRDMVVAGAALLEKHREAVDALNVFPVPDGDTGTNMSLTMASATRGRRGCIEGRAEGRPGQQRRYHLPASARLQPGAGRSGAHYPRAVCRRAEKRRRDRL